MQRDRRPIRGRLGLAAERRRALHLHRLRMVAVAEGNVRRAREAMAEKVAEAEAALAVARRDAGLPDAA